MLESMKIFHTSDWHLGRRFHEVDLTESFTAWIDFVVRTVEEEDVDVLVIAGDVYDRALPPVDSVRMLGAALKRITDLGVSVVMTAGNHDSAIRLGFGAEILRAGDVFIGADPTDFSTPVTLTDSRGLSVDFFLVPYLDTMSLNTVRPQWLTDQVGDEHVQDRRLHEAAFAALRAVERPSGRPRIVLAHVFASGGESTESEREIRQGGIGSIPLSVFEGFDYAALGHLHRRQRLSERIRYSGSPIPFSFSEAGYAKGGLIVTIGASGALDVSAVDFTGYRDVVKLTGTLEELLTRADFEAHTDSFVSVVLMDPQRPRDAMNRVRTRFPHAVELTFGNLERRQDDRYALTTGHELTRAQITTRFFEFVRERDLSDDEKAVVLEAVEAARAKEHEA
jgi:exonuclease SbcD